MPGHKGLLGPHGTGVLVLGRGMLPRPLVVGRHRLAERKHDSARTASRPLRKRHRQPAGDCGPAGWSALRAVSPGGNRAVRRFAGARPAHAPVRPARRARAGATPPRPRWALSALCPPPWTPASCATRWPTRASPCAPGCTVLPPCTSGLARCTRAPAAPAWASTTPKPMWRRWPQPSGGFWALTALDTFQMPCYAV